jgi:dephospho-CoA kinase
MSGTGKSSVVRVLRARGYAAHDLDDEGFTEPRPHGGWGWRAGAVETLLRRADRGVVIVAGCSEEQVSIGFDIRILLAAPAAVITRRIRDRASGYGAREEELSRVLADLAEVEPSLRRTADVVVDATMPLAAVADAVVGAIEARLSASGTPSPG